MPKNAKLFDFDIKFKMQFKLRPDNGIVRLSESNMDLLT